MGNLHGEAASTDGMSVIGTLLLMGDSGLVGDTGPDSDRPDSDRPDSDRPDSDRKASS
jgi:hypothetical protein